MIEVIDIRTKSAMVMDLFEDIEFSPVVFPPAILLLLARHDVFLATLGFRQKKWDRKNINNKISFTSVVRKVI